MFRDAHAEFTWLPTDVTSANFDSILAHTGGLGNVLQPTILDASETSAAWPVDMGSCAGIFCCNMTHIAPVEATEGLIRGAADVLRPGGLLCIYGTQKLSTFQKLSVRSRSLP